MPELLFKVNSPAELIRFVAQSLGTSNTKAKSLLDARMVLVNRRRVWMARHRLKTGDSVEIQDAQKGHLPLDRSAVLFEDEHYIVIDKPSGMLSNGPDSAEEKLRALTGLNGLRAAHRLDRDTSGCLLFAKDSASAESAKTFFRQNRVRKIYHAIAVGRIKWRELKISRRIENRPAETLARVLSASGSASHLRIEIKTGRTHQIRKHLLSTGHPVLGDRQYATRRALGPLEAGIRRQMLHAFELSFAPTQSGVFVRAKAELPEDFKKCLRRCGLS